MTWPLYQGNGRTGVPGQSSWTAPARRPPPAASPPPSPPSSSSSSSSGCQCQACGVGNPLLPLSPGDTRYNRCQHSAQPILFILWFCDHLRISSSLRWSSSLNCASPCSSPFFSDKDRDFTELWLAVWWSIFLFHSWSLFICFFSVYLFWR